MLSEKLLLNTFCLVVLEQLTHVVRLELVLITGLKTSATFHPDETVHCCYKRSNLHRLKAYDFRYAPEQCVYFAHINTNSQVHVGYL